MVSSRECDSNCRPSQHEPHIFMNVRASEGAWTSVKLASTAVISIVSRSGRSHLRPTSFTRSSQAFLSSDRDALLTLGVGSFGSRLACELS